MNQIDLRRVAEKLSPPEVRKNLVRAGLYLAAFELLRHDVVQKTKNFFLSGADRKRSEYSLEYDFSVRALDPHEFDASAKWLVTVSAVTADQATELIGIRHHRNEIAHELPKLLVDPSTNLLPKLLESCRFYIDLLGRFWGGIEADINPDFDGVAVDTADIKSGSSMLMDVIWEAVHGPAT